jgi:protein-S-isoprenylcysteine O-methyltransferase Ste14
MNKPLAHFFDADNLEKFLIVVFYAFLLSRMSPWSSGGHSVINLIYLFDQLWVLVFILVRRKTVIITRKPLDWLVAIAATTLPLFVTPVSDTPAVPLVFAVMLMLSGTAIHLAAKLTIRRSFGMVAANRGIKVNGPYRLVRHPMYTGYMLTHVGLLLGGPTWANFLVVTACWILLLMRIVTEERVLSRDPKYVTMLDRTRFRLIPGIY